MTAIGDRIGHIFVEAPLGHGGMGEVFLGFDEKLQRQVAIKALSAGHQLSPVFKARFLREARILSQMDHPGICRIYDLVESEAQDYLILEYIEGETLRNAAPRLSETELARIFLETTDALAAAHRENIIHRDLKPENLMVSPEGRVKILDFGIARSGEAFPTEIPASAEAFEEPSFSEDETRVTALMSETGLVTREGALIGTLRYMSPEQARGLPVTAASDMYAVGIMMLELLGHQKPYGEGTPVEIRLRIMQGEITIPEDIDPELKSLIEELLRLDPKLRPCAEEAARRMAAFLDRPARIRRRRLIRAAGLVALVLILSSTFLVIQTKWRARKETALARDLEKMVAGMEWRLRAEWLSPAHDMAKVRQQILSGIAEIDNKARELGNPDAAVAAAAKGRILSSLGETEKARSELELAWASGYRDPETAYALGVSLAELYRRELHRARYIPDKTRMEAAISNAEKTLRDPALEYARLAHGSHSAPALYVEALVAFLEKDYDGLRKMADQAVEQAPWFDDAEILVGQSLRIQADIERSTGNYEKALKMNREAISTFQRAVKIGESDPRAHIALCEAEGSVLFLRVWHLGRADDADYRAAVAACSSACSVNSSMARAWMQLAGVHASWAEYNNASGYDIEMTLKAGEEAGKKAAALDPEDFKSWTVLAEIGWILADYRDAHDQDSSSVYRRSILWAQKASALTATDAGPSNMLGLLYLDFGVSLWRNSEETPAILQNAIKAFRKALQIDSDDAMGWTNLSIAQTALASYQFEVLEEDPTATINKAVSSIEEAMKRDSRLALTHRTAGEIHILEARSALRKKQDPREYLSRALASIETSLKASPSDLLTHSLHAQTYLLIARDQLSRGESAARSIHLGLQAVNSGLEINPEYEQLLIWRKELRNLANSGSAGR